MLRIILIRPGSTEFDEQRRIKGTLDLPLSPQGELQAAQTAEELSRVNFHSIYYAPGQASLRTAQRMADGRRVKLKELESLANLDHGLWHGKLIDEVRKTQPRVYRQFQEHPEMVCPPGGEPLEAAEQRARKGLAKLLRKHRDGLIGIVVPEPLASVVRHILTDRALGDLWKAECDTGRWELLDLEAPRQITVA